MRHHLVTVITDANAALCCQYFLPGIIDLQGTFNENLTFLRGCNHHVAHISRYGNVKLRQDEIKEG